MVLGKKPKQAQPGGTPGFNAPFNPAKSSRSEAPEYAPNVGEKSAQQFAANKLPLTPSPAKAQFVKATVNGKDFNNVKDAEKELAIMNLIKSGNKAGLQQLQAETKRNKKIEELQQQGKSATEIADYFLKTGAATGSTTGSATPNNTTTGNLNTKEGFAAEAERQKNLPLSLGEINSDLTNTQTNYIAPGEPFNNPTEFTGGQWIAGVSQVLDLMKINIQGLPLGKFLLGDTIGKGGGKTLTTHEAAWDTSLKILNENIPKIKTGELDPRTVLKDLETAHNSLIQVEGYVHTAGRLDPRYRIDDGYALETQIKQMQNQLDSYKQDILNAQEMYANAQIQNTVNNKALQQQQFNDEYGLK
jgi:hypothetical protein